MQLSHWLNSEEHLLLTASGPDRLGEVLGLAAQSGLQIGLVGEGAPLLSDLTVAENIALASMYHHNLRLSHVLEKIMPVVRGADLEDALARMPHELSRLDEVKVKVVRCIANSNSVLLIHRPSARELEAAFDIAALSGTRLRLWIACQDRHADAYAGFDLRRVPVEEA